MVKPGHHRHVLRPHLLVGGFPWLLWPARFARTHSTPPTTTSGTRRSPRRCAPRRPALLKCTCRRPEPAALPARLFGPLRSTSSHTALRHSPSRRRRSRQSAAGQPDVTDLNDATPPRATRPTRPRPPAAATVAVTPHPDTSVANWSPRHAKPTITASTIDKPGRLEPNYTTLLDWDFYRNCAACTGRHWPFPAKL